MKRIVVNISPFVLNQTVQLYDENGSLLDCCFTSMSSVIKEINKYCAEHEVGTIDLNGLKYLTKKFQKDLLKLDKFQKINIIVH